MNNVKNDIMPRGELSPPGRPCTTVEISDTGGESLGRGVLFLSVELGQAFVAFGHIRPGSVDSLQRSSE